MGERPLDTGLTKQGDIGWQNGYGERNDLPGSQIPGSHNRLPKSAEQIDFSAPLL